MSRTRRSTAVTTVLAACALALGACSLDKIGGNTWSTDSYTYRSEPYAPKTIEVIDVRTDEVVWAIDIPVGWQLDMKFSDDNINSDGIGSSTMKWKLYPHQVKGKDSSGDFIAPPRYARRVDLVLREAPEAPTSETTDPSVAKVPAEEDTLNTMDQ